MDNRIISIIQTILGYAWGIYSIGTTYDWIKNKNRPKGFSGWGIFIIGWGMILSFLIGIVIGLSSK